MPAPPLVVAESKFNQGMLVMTVGFHCSGATELGITRKSSELFMATTVLGFCYCKMGHHPSVFLIQCGNRRH